MLLSENSGLHFPVLFSITHSAGFAICCSRPRVVGADSNKKHLQTQLLIHVQLHTACICSHLFKKKKYYYLPLNVKKIMI